MHPSERLAALVAVLIALALAAFVNFPVTGNYFYADDFYHFYRMRNLPLLEYLFEPHGGHLLPTTYGISYLLFLFAGTRPEPYFWSALATHLLNVALLCLVIRRVTASNRLACFGATLWGTSPVLEEAVEWHAVYGHVLLGTWLLGLLLELTGAEQRGRATRWACIRWVVLLLLAATSFGVGIGIVLVAPVVAFIVLRDSPSRRAIVTLAGLVAAALPLLYVGVQALFGHHERPMIGSVGAIVALLGHLMGYGIARTSLGTLCPQHEFPGALGAGAIILFAGAVVAVWRWGSPRDRRYVHTFLLLALGGYLMIAMGRAVFYGMNRGLVGNADRYQYVGPLLVALCWCVALSELDRRGRVTSGSRTAVLLVAVAAIVGGHLALPRPPIYHFGWSRQETARVLGQILAQIAKAPEGQDVFIENQRFLPLGPFADQVTVPGWAALFVIYFPDNVVAGRRVHFVVSDPRALEFGKHGLRSATLLVPPDAVPPRRADGGAEPRAAPRRAD